MFLLIAIAALVIGTKLQHKVPSESSLKFFPASSGKDLGSILIQEGSSIITLRRKGDVWVVAQPAAGSTQQRGALLPGADTSEQTAQSHEYPVDSAAIATVIEKIESAQKDALVSENPDKQAIFEVDTLKGIKVTLADMSGKKIGTLLIGKNGTDYSCNYVRELGSNSVYMVRGSIRYAVFTDLNRWREKSILKFDKSTAKGITLAKPEGLSITLAADTGSTWNIIEPIKSQANADVVDGILNTLSLLNASDFEDSAHTDEAMGFTRPACAVTISFKNGSSRNLIFGEKKDDTKYWVKVDGKEQVFLVLQSDLENINKSLDDLKVISTPTSGEPAKP